jgi:hypothetical protein
VNRRISASNEKAIAVGNFFQQLSPAIALKLDAPPVPSRGAWSGMKSAFTT